MSSNIVGEASVRITPDSSGFEGRLRSSVTGSATRVARAAAGALVAGGLVRTIATQIGEAGRLQTSLRESVGLLGETGRAADKTFTGFQRNVAALSRELGVAQRTLSDGLYEALGAGIPKRNAVDFLRVSGKAAIAGTTDLATAVDGLTTVLNVYGLDASQAQRVSDSLFQTVNAGKARFDELAQSFFNVGPVASAAGVSLETVGAALATLTAGGVPAAEATTQLRGVIQSLVAPSVRAEKLIGPVFERAGFSSGQAAVKALGFQKALGLVVAEAGGSTVKLSRMLGRVEAVNAAFTLTGKGAGLFTQQLKAQQNAAGVTDRALAQIERSAGRSFARAGNAARNFGLALGDAAAPAVARLADALESGLNRVTSGAGFQTGVARFADGIADALLDPRTLSTLQTFGTTAATTLGAIRDAAQAAAPAIQALAEAFSAVVSSPLGPQLILTAAAMGTVSRVIRPLATSFTALRGAQAASAVAATGFGVKAAGAAASTSRFALAASGLGRGLLALSGGPVGATVLGVSALAAGALLLSQRQGNAAQQAQTFSNALRDQAAAANAAADALGKVRSNTASLAQGRVATDQARAQVTGLRGQIRTTQATPAADLGGEAAKTQQLTALKNQLRVAEINLGQVQKANAATGRQAVTDIQAQAGATRTEVDQANRLAAASGISAQQQAKAALATGLNRDAVFRYAQGLGQTTRAQARAAAQAQALATTAGRQARIVDQSTAAGKRQAAALNQEAAAAARTATVQRGRAIATARQAIEANKAIIASSRSTAAEKQAAQERVKVQEGVVGKVRAAAKRAGDASGQGFIGGIKSKLGAVRGAGQQAGQSAAQGAGAAAPQANAAGVSVGTEFGQGVVAGIDSFVGQIRAAGARAAAAADQGGTSPAGLDTDSPSKKGIRLGRDYGRGLAQGIQTETGRVASAAARAAAAAIRAAGAAGVRNARTQGRLTAVAIADGFRVTGPTIKATIKTAVSTALQESIQTARSNLEGFASTLADLAGQAIDAAKPDFTARSDVLTARGQALDAAAGADEERRLRNAVALAEAGRANAQKRYQAALAAQQRRTPEQDARLDPVARERERQRLEDLRLAAEDPTRQARLDLERFLLGQDQSRLDAEQTTADRQAEIQKQGLARQLADLTANLNAKAISVGQFNEQLASILGASAPAIAGAGARLGTAFANNFDTALRSFKAQGLQVSIAPLLPASFLAGIERPTQAAIAEAVTTRNVLRAAFTTELERVRQSQLANRQALEATFRKESSDGGARITTSEQRQLKARAEQHTDLIKELRALQRAFVQNPPQESTTVIVNPPPGATAEGIAEAIARRTSRRTIRESRR